MAVHQLQGLLWMSPSRSRRPAALLRLLRPGLPRPEIKLLSSTFLCRAITWIATNRPSKQSQRAGMISCLKKAAYHEFNSPAGGSAQHVQLTLVSFLPLLLLLHLLLRQRFLPHFLLSNFYLGSCRWRWKPAFPLFHQVLAHQVGRARSVFIQIFPAILHQAIFHEANVAGPRHSPLPTSCHPSPPLAGN